MEAQTQKAAVVTGGGGGIGSALSRRLAQDGFYVYVCCNGNKDAGAEVVSHIRAEAEAAGVLLSDGLFQRLERVLALIIGLVIPGAMLPVLVLLSVLGTVTVVQRVYSALRGA